jgi:hypothetical protein
LRDALKANNGTISDTRRAFYETLELGAVEILGQQLWPEDTFVDFDHGLNAAV